jgi:hypothetical protein
LHDIVGRAPLAQPGKSKPRIVHDPADHRWQKFHIDGSRKIAGNPSIGATNESA